MLPPDDGIDEFRARYRTFVADLERATNGTGGSLLPDWAAELFSHPFEFPFRLRDDPRLNALRERLQALAVHYGGVPACTDAAAEIVREHFRDHTMPMAAPTEGATRGERRGRKKAKKEPAEVSASDDGLLSVPEERPHLTRSKPRMAPESSAPSPVAAPAPAPVATPLPPEKRYLNAGIKDHPIETPLIAGEVYTLQFGVDLKKGGESGSEFSSRLPDEQVLIDADKDSVELTIQLDGDDFDIAPRTRVLTVPRRGPSPSRVNFAISPKHKERCTVTATVHKAGNFLFEMEIAYSVGTENATPAESSLHGRPLGAATRMQPRELGLRLKPVTDGYECTIWGATANQVTLPITETELGDIVARTRKAMMDVVTYSDDRNRKVFQSMIDIEPASRDAALRILAFAGAEMFQRLFYGPLAGADVNGVGDFLRARAMKAGQVLKLQVVAERFPIPWGMLYVGETGHGATLDWECFLGMRHIIEQIPRQASMLVEDSIIVSDAPSLAMSVTVNDGIDAQMKMDVVARQVQFWTGRGAAPGSGLQLAQRRTKSELLDALHARTNDQLMYLYCHAITAGPADPGGINGSSLVLSGDERVTLAELNREAPMRQPLPGNPLVFLNACESAELTPAFYDGFVPYFMAKGARGVVGTECKTPALFATEWAMRFFPRFLGGAPLGELFLELRREFYQQHGNPLGLLYAVYCDGDTQVQPGLPS